LWSIDCRCILTTNNGLLNFFHITWDAILLPKYLELAAFTNMVTFCPMSLLLTIVSTIQKIVTSFTFFKGFWIFWIFFPTHTTNSGGSFLSSFLVYFVLVQRGPSSLDSLIQYVDIFLIITFHQSIWFMHSRWRRIAPSNAMWVMQNMDCCVPIESQHNRTATVHNHLL